MNRLLFVCLICLSSFSVISANSSVSLEGPMTQGGLIVGKTLPGAIVKLNGEVLRVTPTGQFVFGFGRDAAPKHELAVTLPDQSIQTIPLTIAQRKYDIQRVEGVPQKTVTPPADQLARIRKETALVVKARKTNSDRLDFLQGFIWPVTGPISGVYGSQRFYNGEARRPHFGVDVARPTGTLVFAPADGVVTLAHKDMFFSGGTLILDHGYGVSSSFIHLSDVLVEPGIEVKRGDPIAKVGSTGRATGPHLDWRINWFGTRIDPQLLAGPMPMESTTEK